MNLKTLAYICLNYTSEQDFYLQDWDGDVDFSVTPCYTLLGNEARVIGDAYSLNSVYAVFSVQNNETKEIYEISIIHPSWSEDSEYSFIEGPVIVKNSSGISMSYEDI